MRNTFRNRCLFWLGMAIVALLALRILHPPVQLIHRQDSPDGRYSARLFRTRYVARDSLVVRLKRRILWRTVYYSPPLSEELTEPARLQWSADGERLYLLIGEQPVWGYDLSSGRALP